MPVRVGVVRRALCRSATCWFVFDARARAHRRRVGTAGGGTRRVGELGSGGRRLPPVRRICLHSPSEVNKEAEMSFFFPDVGVAVKAQTRPLSALKSLGQAP
jgi:hypothetical protein